MDTMQQEVQCQEYRLVRQVIVDVEQEPVESVLQNGPHNVAEEEAQHGFDIGIDWERQDGGQRQSGVDGERRERATELKDGAKAKVDGYGQPDGGDDIP